MHDSRTYWAQRRTKTVGPYATRNEAVEAFRAKYPFKGPDYGKSAKRNQIMVGYGAHGPVFDICWYDAKE